MAYTDDYVKTNWVNKPATNTPINQTNLNHLEQGVKNNCGRVANLSTTKAEQSDLLTVFKSVSFDSATGTFTFTRFNDTVVTINTDLEKIAVNFDYDDDPTSAHYQNLIITLADGTVKYADLSALITQYEFTDTATIDITVSAGGTISASVIDGSITASKLQPNYLADVTAQANIATNGANTATSQALVSEGWAKGTQNGTPVASGSPYYENNAEYFKNQAQQIAGAALGGLSDVTITTPTNGQVLTYDADNNIWRNSDGGSVETKSGNPLSLTTDSAQVARSTKVTLSPIQASGTPTPSNPIPIYGYDNVELSGSGKNLVEGVISGYNIGGDGVIASNASYDMAYGKVVKGTQYVVTTNAGLLGAGFFTSKPHAGSTSYNGARIETSSYTFTAPITGYVAFRVNANYAYSQLELGSTATAYEPYTEATDIFLPLPGTVYGGELDVESGVLKVTHKGVDMGDLSWTYYSPDQIFYTDGLTDILASVQPLCSIYPYQYNTNKSFWVQSNNKRTFVKDLDYTDGAVFKTAVTGQKIVYELATPYTIQLTPHQVRLLEGANVITSNGLTISLVYRTGKIATLKDLDGIAKTINETAEIANGTKSADQITAGTFSGPVKANPTAMANLGTAQVRSIIVTDTAPTVGSSTTIPDGTLIIVYE